MMDMQGDGFGDRLRMLRKGEKPKGPERSQERFALLLGRDASVISRYENGENKPGLEFLQALQREHPQLRMAWLLNGDEPALEDTASYREASEELLEDWEDRTEEDRRHREFLDRVRRVCRARLIPWAAHGVIAELVWREHERSTRRAVTEKRIEAFLDDNLPGAVDLVGASEGQRMAAVLSSLAAAYIATERRVGRQAG